MSKYTKDAPFEFEGVKVWADETELRSDYWADQDEFGHDFALALHAFIEAERDEWVYTNDEHTEARKGRWVVEWWNNGIGGRSCWAIWHDDLSALAQDALIYHEGLSVPGDDRRWVAIAGAKKMLDDFLAWHAAQNQPAEPTGLGAVVRFDRDGRTWLIVRVSAKWWEAFVEPGKFRKCKWDEWLEDATDITILSPGVAS